MVTLFALGRAVSQETQENVTIEALAFRDILQQSFWDVYETLTYKVTSCNCA